MKKLRCLLPWLLTAPLWGYQTAGQDTTPAEQKAASQSQAADQSADRAIDNKTTTKQKQKPKQDSGKSNDRIFYTLPNFLTVENAANAPPLSTGQKFKITLRDSFDPVQFVWYGALAGIAQAEDDDPQFGEGAKGYGERYGERFGDGVIENFMSKAVFPSVLHQDPRYYQLGQGSFWHRVLYAVSRVAITRSDSGATQVNFSEILGSATAAGISSWTYHPEDERNVSNALSVCGTQVAYDALGYVVKEFWPDIRRKLHKSKPGQADLTHGGY